MHLPPPNLPRFGGGERPPILYKPPPPLTITMGLRLGSLQALTPRERRSRFPPARPSGPLSRIGNGGGGIGQMRLRLPLERICALYGFRFFVGEKSKSVSSTASDWGLGAEPQACFGSFYTSKRNAPAAAVQIRITKKLSPPKVSRNYHLNIPPEAETSPQGMRRAGRPARPARGSSRPARRCRPGRRSRPGGPPGGRGCPVRCGVPDNPAG